MKSEPTEQRNLDAQIAKPRYESLSERVAQAEMVLEMEKRYQGASLKILDPPGLPQDSRLPLYMYAPGGLAGGATLGWAVSLVAGWKRPATAEA